MFRIYQDDRLVSPSFYVTAHDVVHAVNGMTGFDPREGDPSTTADEQAALLVRDRHWHAERGFYVREENPWAE